MIFYYIVIEFIRGKFEFELVIVTFILFVATSIQLIAIFKQFIFISLASF